MLSKRASEQYIPREKGSWTRTSISRLWRGLQDHQHEETLSGPRRGAPHGLEDTNNDRATIEWTNTPDGAAKQFRREWSRGDGMTLHIEMGLG
ncbi:hypothetical protein PRIPAC_70199 [Pristionchus pacificus]|uniref:Uncharacterized protein n=1 Tax=Pristionchus pacificus TaxID=54126 RepID=A0A2A6CFM7_PRIPA|nr:hypothetical protein PRIPAC_70199 [Pristionchus pacificus]|eukprot:PDM76900.1 hypothetical protein PRIPAC_42295 [Pristionchus pacificus]